MCFRKSFSNTHMKAPAWLEIMKQVRTPIIYLFSYITRYIWNTWLISMKNVHECLIHRCALKCKCNMFMYIYICEIYVQIYYGNFKSDLFCIHTKCTIWTISTSPWHEIYSTNQSIGYGLTEHDTYLKYIVHRWFKLVGWYPLTALTLRTVYFM